ncbi:MAG: two-component response regulator [Cyanobacteria bacterium RYN_339]|nr:two-component response regulator [Cyanobacteria bacterium RYN_339]
MLLVEDDALLRATLLAWLQTAGYPVAAARDGHEALALALEQPFDVVVTDLKMPGMDGLALQEVLVARLPDVAFIFLSGQATIGDAIEALREGRAFDFLQKPLATFTELGRAIGRAWQHRLRAGASAAVALPAPESPAWSKVLAYIDRHFREPLSLTDVAAALGYTPSYLTHLVKRETGQTVQRWIISRRMEEAQRMLAGSDMPVTAIAHAVGYTDPNHFVRQFRQLMGVPPMAWRQARAAQRAARAEDEPAGPGIA